jgi:hypothetical protein
LGGKFLFLLNRITANTLALEGGNATILDDLAMATVRINSLREGMTLAQDVKDMNGRLLLRQGVSLLERHITLFKSWGVTEVELLDGSSGGAESAVTGDSKQDSQEQLRLAAKAKAEEQLHKIFSANNLSDPMISEFFTLCVARKAKLPW